MRAALVSAIWLAVCAHHHATSHPIVRSYEPGEDWYWCYADDLFFELEGAPPAPSHP